MAEVQKIYICPICKKSFVDTKYRPFCSKRCADVDLGNWFNGAYRFEAQEVDDEDVEELSKLDEDE